MAITSADQLVAAFAGAQRRNFLKQGGGGEGVAFLFDHFLSTGFPGAGAAPAGGLSGEAVDNTFAGDIPYTNAVSGQNYLGSVLVNSSTVGMPIVYDRLWHNSGIVVTTTTAQTVNSVAFPARDENGSTNGEGVEIALTVTTATTNASAITNITVSYTNSDGTAGRTATMTSFPATAALGTMVLFNLQSGDKGVRSIQSITLGTSLVTGAVSLVALRRLASMPANAANTGSVFGFYDIGSKLYNGTALVFMSMQGSSVSPVLLGELKIING